jgi:hypothetical protein
VLFFQIGDFSHNIAINKQFNTSIISENDSEIIINSKKQKKYEDDKKSFSSFIGSVLFGKL